MKYRMLTKDELGELEAEFITFLASNGLPAEKWLRIRDDEPEKREALIALFSDVVFEKILSSVHYLEHRQPDTIRIFSFGDQNVTMNGVHIVGNSDIDFTKDQDASSLIRLFKLSTAELKIFTAEKPRSEDRLHEIFDLMQNGAQILKDDRLYHTIEELNNPKP